MILRLKPISEVEKHLVEEKELILSQTMTIESIRASRPEVRRLWGYSTLSDRYYLMAATFEANEPS